MAVILTSNTQSEQERIDAFAANGLTVLSDPADTATTKPGEEQKPSEKSDEPGETSAAKSDDESGSVSETDKTNSQEAADEEAPATGAEAKKPSRSNFKSKLVQEQEISQKALEDLAAERRRVQDLESRLAAKEAAEVKPEEKKVDEGPKKPKRPQRADVDYDDEKFEVAMDAYEAEKAEYDKTILLKAIADQEQAKQEKASQDAIEAARQKEQREYAAKVQAGSAEYSDWDEVMAELDPNIKMPIALERTILESDNPAHLLYHFMRNPALVEEFAQLTPVRQVLRANKIEADIIASRKAAEKKPEAKPAADERTVEKPQASGVPREPVESAPPAKPRDPRQDPIAPVGARSAGSVTSLAQATTPAEYRKLRAAGITE